MVRAIAAAAPPLCRATARTQQPGKNHSFVINSLENDWERCERPGVYTIQYLRSCITTRICFINNISHENWRIRNSNIQNESCGNAKHSGGIGDGGNGKRNVPNEKLRSRQFEFRWQFRRELLKERNVYSGLYFDCGNLTKLFTVLQIGNCVHTARRFAGT